MCTEDSPSGLWRTLGKRVGCKPSGVRIPHPPPPDPGTASGSGVFVACGAAGVACGAAGVPGAVGPGRPRDRHTRACGSEWSISKPARALRTLRRPPHLWDLRGCCGSARRLEALPGPATAHGHRSLALLCPPNPPAPSTSVGPSRLMLLGASARSPARPRYLLRTRQPDPSSSFLLVPKWCYTI